MTERLIKFFYEDSDNPVQVDVSLNIFKYEVLYLVTYKEIRGTQLNFNGQGSHSARGTALGVSVIFFSLYLIRLKIIVFICLT